MDSERITILGIPVDNIALSDLDRVAEELINNNQINQIVFITTLDLLKARRNKEYGACIRQASLVIPTTRGLVWGAGVLRKNKPERHMPFEFLIHLLGSLEKLKGSLFLLGQKKGELQTIEQNLRTSFPELRFVGRYNGYYPKELKSDIITAIKKAAPSLLIAGRGLPKKDLWIYENMKQFNPGMMIWCGGCFDIFSGKRERPSKGAWKTGFYRIPGFLIRPWRIVRLFAYLYYGVGVIFGRLQK